MSQVTEAMIEAGIAQLDWYDGEQQTATVEAIYLAMSSASPPVEQSEGVGLHTADGLPIIADDLTPPPVTVSVERFRFANEKKHWTQRDLGEEHRDMLEEARRLWKYLDGCGWDDSGDSDGSVTDMAIGYIEFLLQSKEGHSLSTVSGVVK